MKILILGLTLLGVTLSAQDDRPFKAPSKEQRADLEILVKCFHEGAMVQIGSLEPELVERRIRKALFNQFSETAILDLRDTITETLAEDLGLSSRQGPELVRGDPLSAFVEDLREHEERTLAEVLERKSPDVSKWLKYFSLGFSSLAFHHGRLLKHDQEELSEFKALVEVRIDKEQARGCTELAKYYAPRIWRRFDLEGKLRQKALSEFQKRLEEGFKTRLTARAGLATIARVKALVRPSVHAELKAESDEAKLAAEAQLEKLVVDGLRMGELLDKILADHRAMIANPKEHRKVVRSR